MNADRVETLLDRYFDQALSTGEHAELESLLLAWPQARTLFWKRSRFNALLRRRGRENWGKRLALEQTATTGTAPWWIWPWRWWHPSIAPKWTWAAAGAFSAWMLTALVWSFFRTPPAKLTEAVAVAPAAASERYAQGIATILRQAGVEWTDGRRHTSNILGPGKLKFSRGLIELEFHRGARMVVEGPAEFELLSDMKARCIAGKVRAEIPSPSLGFELLTPVIRVVDHGTSFGVLVERNGPCEVHVFNGDVNLVPERRDSGSESEVHEGHAVRIDPSGVQTEIANGRQKFATAETVEQRADIEMAARYAAWRAESNRLDLDPSVLIHYTFENSSPSDRVLHNRAPSAAPESDGTIIGCHWTSGRWAAKQALDFKQVGDRVRLALPEEHEEMTCIASVRLDGIDHPYTALLMSGDAFVGELQWQLKNQGALSVGKRTQPGWGWTHVDCHDTTQVIRPALYGNWMQVAFVYDGKAGTITQYLDGRRLISNTMWIGKPLKTGALEIGNWTPAGGNPVEPIRNFNGRMDEFLVFSRALNDQEIQQVWDSGRAL